jgi:hypothetical protein
MAVDADNGLAAGLVATVGGDLAGSSNHGATHSGSFFRRTTEK